MYLYFQCQKESIKKKNVSSLGIIKFNLLFVLTLSWINIINVSFFKICTKKNISLQLWLYYTLNVVSIHIVIIL